MLQKFIACLCLVAACGCSTTSPAGKAETGPSGTHLYLVEVETSSPDVRIEANGEYVGKAPCTLRIFGDRDGTFHNFGRQDYTIRAYPTRPGEHEQVKVFRTGGWFSEEDQIPKKVFFDMTSENWGTGAAPTKSWSGSGKKE